MARASRRRRDLAVLRDSEIFSLLRASGANLRQTAELASDLLRSWPDERDLRARITGCERAGDQLTRKIIERLYGAQLTTMRRDDIYALVGAIDDIVDDIEEVCEELAVYRIEAPMQQGEQLAAIARDAARALARALEPLPSFEAVEEEAQTIRDLEHEGDRVYRQAVAALFEGGIDPMVVLRWKDVFQGLEDAVDRTRQASDILQGLAVTAS